MLHRRNEYKRLNFVLVVMWMVMEMAMEILGLRNWRIIGKWVGIAI